MKFNKTKNTVFRMYKTKGPDLIKKENKKIVMFSHDKAKSNFAIVSVYKSSNLKLEYYFTNNLQFKSIYSDL